MRLQFIRSLLLTVVFVVLLGVAYPVAGWALSQLAFHSQANGSLTANGSTLIGQPWNNGTSINPRWFNGRPDADNPLVLNGVSGESGAANYGPRSEGPGLGGEGARRRVERRRRRAPDRRPGHVVGVRTRPGHLAGGRPGPGADGGPSRSVAPATLYRLITSQTHGAQFGFLGAPYLNVLQLNEALAKLVAPRT